MTTQLELKFYTRTQKETQMTQEIEAHKNEISRLESMMKQMPHMDNEYNQSVLAFHKHQLAFLYGDHELANAIAGIKTKKAPLLERLMKRVPKLPKFSKLLKRSKK